MTPAKLFPSCLLCADTLLPGRVGECLIQGPSQCLVLVVAANRGVHRRGRPPGMTNLLLDEQVVKPVLQKMRHVGVPQTVRAQLARQSEVVAVRGEPGVDVIGRDPRAALGRPQPRTDPAVVRADSAVLVRNTQEATVTMSPRPRRPWPGRRCPARSP